MGKPSIFALTVLIPIYGWIWLIIAFFADSQKDLNEHDESIDFKKLFPEIFSDLDLIIENNLTLIKIKGVKVFIRKENYRYTIVAGSDNYYLINNYIRECSPNFLIIETGKYTYCKHIKRAELEKIIRENTNVI
jgi:predicted nucleic acid-binding Zn finger protein